MKTTDQYNGFTLVEMLIVVLILAILSAIAVPNFLEYQTRAKISRVHSDLRTLSIAIEAYAGDNISYPPSPVFLGPRFRRFRPLTTPISYMTTIPIDPFNSTDPNAGGFGRFSSGMYAYGAMPLDIPDHWALASDGPDRQDDTSPIRFYPGYSAELFSGQVSGFDYTVYDPTNGTLSRGDIFRASDYNPYG